MSVSNFVLLFNVRIENSVPDISVEERSDACDKGITCADFDDTTYDPFSDVKVHISLQNIYDFCNLY